MKIKLLAHTPNPDEVVAQGGKLCYYPGGIDELEESLTEEKVSKFVSMLADMGHESPLEHAVFTFGIEGVSRSLTHQLVRHRIASYSQKSQRYVREGQFEYIIPDEIADSPKLKNVFIRQMHDTQNVYDYLTEKLIEKYLGQGMKPSMAEKKAIENARAVLPNACETKIIATMNARVLLHFFSKRCCDRAQDEIRDLAWKMLGEVQKVAPNIFRNAGPECVRGKCPEGFMSCGNPKN